MSEFETQSLATAKATLYTYIAADVIAGLTFFAVLIGAVIAWRNVRSVIWNSLLSFEQDMATRRTKFQDLAAKIKDDKAELTQLMFDEAKESYFNSLDRLASSILNGHFPDKEMKQDYLEVLTEVVRGFPNDFHTGSRYRKVIKLFNRWNDQK